MTREDHGVAVKGIPTSGRDHVEEGKPDVARATPDTVLLSAEVAVTGSPNTVMNVHFDVRSAHLHRPLLGSLLAVIVPVSEQNEHKDLLVLGQVATLRMQNRWHEELALKNYLKVNGRLPHLTGVGDTVTGILQIIGAYSTQELAEGRVYEKTTLAVPPGSGLGLYQVDRRLVHALMQRETGYAYLGYFYRTNEVPAPVLVNHFGDVDQQGFGEAYMDGCFGPAGSGKSVTTATLAALFAHNPQMGILILDPQSEFTENALARGSAFEFNFHEMLERTSGGRFDHRRDCIKLDQLQLEGAEMFVQVLAEKGFFKLLGLSGQKAAEALDYVTRFLEDLKSRKLWNTSMEWNAINNLRISIGSSPGGSTIAQQSAQSQLTFAELFTGEAANAYAATGRASYAKKFRETWQKQSHLERLWQETVELFSPQGAQGQARVSLGRVLQESVLHGHIRILDLNPETIEMSERFKLYLMDFVFKKLRQLSHIYYRSSQTGNCLIVIDEAGRYIAQDTGSDLLLRELCKKLVFSVKEMRKMRCGFLFITQTTTEIQKDILRNLHFRIYGVGLGVGADADNIRSLEGDEAFELYRTLPDPRLSGRFSFMVAGRLLALGSSGRPMVIEGFPSGQAVLVANRHLLHPHVAYRQSVSGSTIR
jgi:Helicase HerA, central domain